MRDIIAVTKCLIQIRILGLIGVQTVCKRYLRNEFNFWNVNGSINTLGLIQSKCSSRGFTLTLQETRSIHDSMNIRKLNL